MIQNQKNQKLMKEIRQKLQNYLKGLISKKGDYDDLVDTDIDLETNDEESEEIDQIEESKEYDLESDKTETDERDQIKNPELIKRIDSQKRR